MATLSFGHLATDASQGAVPALLPFLIGARGFSVAQASLLVLAATVASSILQPIFGLVSDQRSLPWLIPIGPLVAALGIAAVAFTPSFPATFAVITCSGIGVAGFHPEASRYASYISVSRPATGMSLFSVGGNAGFALGPAIVAVLVTAFGLRGCVGFVALGVVAATLTGRELARLRTFRPARRLRVADGLVDHWGAFVRLAFAVVLRSGVYFGLLTFAPLWFERHLHTTKAAGDAALTAMLAAGALGTLVGGRLGDRFGPRPVFIVSMAVVAPLVGAFMLCRSPLPAAACLTAVGGATIATFSTTVVIGQQLLPRHLGIASGVMLGLSIGAGGVIAAILGSLVDSQGLTTVIGAVALMPLGALALASSLPRRAQQATLRPDAVVLAAPPV